MNDSAVETVFSIVARLVAAKLSYSLEMNRDDAIAILVAVPGQRWEIEVFRDGEVNVEVFRSPGEIYGVEYLKELIQNFAD